MLKKKDVIFIASVLLALLILFCFFGVYKDKATVVNVYVDNALIDSLPIKNTVKTYTTEYGYNILKIENGKVFITESDCDNKTCIKTSPIEKKGESIICAPHRLLVELK